MSNRQEQAVATRPQHLALIGSVGIPNRYGGPEAFAESIAPALARRGLFVTVTCERARYSDDLSAEFRGVRRVFIPVGANGVSSPVHDLLAFLAVFRKSDFVLVLGVSGGLFFPFMRLLAAMARCRLLVNIDGIEWRRPKFSVFGRLVLFCSDWLAQRFAHFIIYDNDALKPYVRHPAKSLCVEYSGDQAVMQNRRGEQAGTSLPAYALTICRIEPENNCHLLIDAFLGSSRPLYMFVGNWDRSDYGRELRQRYAGEPRLQLIDPIYDPEQLFRLRKYCSWYLHGHSVGGTNPSLVEILFFDCHIFCWDCSFNRATAGEAAQYFAGIDQLVNLLNVDADPSADRSAVRRRYSTETIAVKLVDAFAFSRREQGT